MTEKQNMLAYLRHQPCDFIPESADIISFRAAYPNLCTVDLPICERPMSSSGYDVFGVHWTAAVEGCHRTPDQKPILTDITQWRSELRIPKVECFDWDYAARQVEGVDRERTIVRTTLTMGPFERFSVLYSFEDCLADTALEPEACAELLNALADYKVAVIQKLGEVVRPDVILVHDDWGTARAPFLSPQAWRQLLRPPTQRIYDAIHSIGAVAGQHSCGNIGLLIGDLVEMGVDLWQGQGGCNDVEALQKAYSDRIHMVFTYIDPNAPAVKVTFPDGMLSNTTYPSVPDFLY